MQIKNFLYNRKILLLNVILFLYVVTNLIGGERGLISYFEKLNYLDKLKNEKKILSMKLEKLEIKNRLLSDNPNIDFIDTLYREKLKLGNPGEIIIKLNNEK